MGSLPVNGRSKTFLNVLLEGVFHIALVIGHTRIFLRPLSVKSRIGASETKIRIAVSTYGVHGVATIF